MVSVVSTQPLYTNFPIFLSVPILVPVIFLMFLRLYPFLKEVVRQINALPVPAAMNPDRQKEDCIRLVIEVSRRDMRAFRLVVGVLVVVVILSAITVSMLPADFIPTGFFQFK